MTNPAATGVQALGDWRPIASLPYGEHVLLYFPNGELGIGGMETATIYIEDAAAPLKRGWTHGGANAGSDWEFCEKPTHWMPLPKAPGAVMTNPTATQSGEPPMDMVDQPWIAVAAELDRLNEEALTPIQEITEEQIEAARKIFRQFNSKWEDDQFRAMAEAIYLAMRSVEE